MIGGCVWNCKYNGPGSTHLKDILLLFCEDHEALGFECRCFVLYNLKLRQSGNVPMDLFPCKNKEKT